MPARPSLVLTCHNFRPYVAETLASVQAQTVEALEVIVVDNNSTDGSVDEIARVAARDARVVLLHEPRQGVHHALNAGLARAAGDPVLLLDGDDVCRPERVARTLGHFARTGADLVACNGQRIDADGRLEEPFEPYFHSAGAMPLVACQYNPIWTVSFLALRRSALRAIGELPAEYSRILDWHLLLSAYERGLGVSFLDEPLVLKRYHGRNLALDLEATEAQAIPRLDRFMARYPGVASWYDEADRGRLLTVRYLRAAEQMRRAGRWQALTTYLADRVGPGRIREVVQRFVAGVAWHQLDRARFQAHVAGYAAGHPLWAFAQGVAASDRGDHEGAALLFERAYVTAYRRFKEALNSWAVAVAHVERDRALALLEQLVQWNPDYRDARLNLAQVRQGELRHLRHTVCLRPETLHWLADWP